jgi:hypothetical protein
MAICFLLTQVITMVKSWVPDLWTKLTIAWFTFEVFLLSLDFYGLLGFLTNIFPDRAIQEVN